MSESRVSQPWLSQRTERKGASPNRHMVLVFVLYEHISMELTDAYYFQLYKLLNPSPFLKRSQGRGGNLLPA